MTKLSTGVILIALAAFSASAEAQDGAILPYAEHAKAAVQDVTISVSDNVQGGCLPRPSALADVVERRFETAGISRSEESTNTIWVSVLGYAMSESVCAVSLAMRIDALSPISSSGLPENVSPLAFVTLSSRSTIMTGPKDDMQAQINDGVAQMSDIIAQDIVRARSLMGR